MTRPAMGDPFFDKGLPSNVEAERSILGAILLDNAVCNQAIELLRRDDFFLDSHRRIFDKMISITERLMPIDLITLSDELRRAGEFEQIGGATYIASLIDGVPRTDTIEPYARLVKQKSMLRKLISASQQIVSLAFEEEDDADVIIDNKPLMVKHQSIPIADSSLDGRREVTIKASAPGFESQEIKVRVRAAEEKTVNIELKPRAE